MKKFIASLMFFAIGNIQAQTDSTDKPVLAVLNMDCKIPAYNNESAGNVLRIAAENTGQFEIMDIYDIKHITKTKGLDYKGCFGKICLTSMGKELGADLALYGNAEYMGNAMHIQLRMIDIKTGKVTHTLSKDYIQSSQNFAVILNLALYEMLGLPFDKELSESLSYFYRVSAPKKVEDVPHLSLSGPRMGFSVLTGENASIFRDGKESGGFDSYPFFFQFGYQFEKQYLNEGNFQALFEFIPMISGMDQGLLIPSLTVMNGLRWKNGFEFAFGPTVSLAKMANGYYDADGNWRLNSSYTDTVPNPFPSERRLDSRGDLALQTGFIFALGYTYSTKTLNIPINAYVVPSVKGVRFGVSFGYNSRKKEIYVR